MAEITLTSENFDKEITNYKGTVLVDFWASWCGPCKMLAPIVHEISEEYAETVKVCKVNVDDAMELAQAYHIVSIPTLILFKDGKPVNKVIGYVNKSEIVKMWN